MEFVSAKQMIQLEKKSVKLGVPSLLLMENAGRSVAQFIEATMDIKRKVLVLCGTGNNAGDGMVVARHLSNTGWEVNILFTGKKENLSADGILNYTACKKSRIHFIPKKVWTGSESSSCFSKYDILVDALFGTGLNRIVEEPYRALIEFVNDSNKCVVSVDVPSGLNADTGEVMGVAVKANHTIALGRIKIGLKSPEASDYIGEVWEGDIAIPWKGIKQK